MRQVLHILRWDIRHLWPEIAATILAVSFLQWANWHNENYVGLPKWYLNVLPMIAAVLSWWLLAVRTIQADGLVGDRQFWVTRPYLWYQMLLAKALFLVLFCAVPLCLSEISLLVIAKAPIFPNVPGIAYDLIGAMFIAVLPLAVGASLTRTVPQVLLWLLVLAALVAGCIWLDGVVPDQYVATGSETADTIEAVAFAALAILGLCLRYARRHRLYGAVAIAVAVVSVPAVMIATPYRTLLVHAFPLARTDALPFQATFIADEETGSKAFDDTESPRVAITIPIRFSGIAADDVIRPNGAMLSIDFPPVKTWESPWQSTSSDLLEDGKIVGFTINIDRAVYRRARANLTPVRVSLAVSLFQEQHREQFFLERAFDLPGVGPCKWRYGLHCRSSSTVPHELLLTCSDANATRQFVFSNADHPFSPLYRVDLTGTSCGGTKFTIGTPELVRRFRFDLPLGSLRLSKYGPRLSN